jgi:RimJ/RimL family protein N-acetyltransferase
LTGQFVSLKPVDATADAAALYAASHRTPQHQAVWRFSWYGPFTDAGAMQQWLSSLAASDDPMFFTATQISDRQPVGMISIMSIVAPMGRAELGNIWYAPEAQRTKINTEATFLCLRYLFDELKYRRVEWKCDARNERSRQAALRMGFVFEGIFRQHMVVKGENRDTAWFSLIDHEWPQRKANFSRWLYATDSISLRVLNQPDPAI